MFYYLRNKYLQEYNFFNIWAPYCSINRTHIWKDKVFLSPLRNILVITSGCKHITHLLLDVRILLWVICPVLSLRLVTEMTLMKIGGRDWLGSLGQKDPKEKWRLSAFGLMLKMSNGPEVNLIFAEGQRCQKCLNWKCLWFLMARGWRCQKGVWFLLISVPLRQ